MQFEINPETIKAIGAATVIAIQTGKLIGAEVKDFVQRIFGEADPTLTPEQLNAITVDTISRAEIREALSLAEAGRPAVQE